MDLKSTILLPTYNRPQDLRKLLDYLAHSFDLNKVRVLVLDGSDSKNQTVNRRACEGLQVDYKSYGSSLSYVERLLEGLQSTETESVIILGDDDILSPKGFSECVSFLHENKDYTIAHGQYIGFNITSQGCSFNKTYHSVSIEDNSPLKRLFSFFSSYTAPTIYAVCRTASLQKSFEELIKNDIDISDYVNVEIMASAIPVAQGKLKRLSSFFQARRFSPAPPDKYVSYAKYIMADDFSGKHQKIKKSIINNLPDKEDLKEATASNAIDLAFAAYFGQRVNQQEIVQRFNALGLK